MAKFTIEQEWVTTERTHFEVELPEGVTDPVAYMAEHQDELNREHPPRDKHTTVERVVRTYDQDGVLIHMVTL